jgi:hypothetical protein
MKPELEQKIYEIAPILYTQKDMSMMHTCMCWGIECPDDWFGVIYELSKQLEDLNTKYKDKHIEVQAVQVKEKFNSLRFYVDIKCEDNNDKHIRELFESEVYDLIDIAEEDIYLEEKIKGIMNEDY